jgi:SAM-dependent methyltransferase
VPDPIFDDPRLAPLYDVFDGERSDLDLYEAVITELGASSVLDVGCGTGTLACRLAAQGFDVVGVDPARASLDVARAKRGADAVRWVHGDASDLPQVRVDVAVMTGNVAQVFLTDRSWAQALVAMAKAVRHDGWLVFESRDPATRDWERWSEERSVQEAEVPGVGLVETWTELIEVSLPFVSFRHVFRFHTDGTEVVSDSTLRFRSAGEIARTLDVAGFDVRDVRDAPDRPGMELVVIAQRQSHTDR